MIYERHHYAATVESGRTTDFCRRHGEQGSIIILVAIVLVILGGVVGLAVDGGQLYATKQRAQAAADAAAQAGAIDIFNHSAATADATARSYAQMNGFTGGETSVSYPPCAGSGWCDGHVTLSNIDHPNIIEVTITRTVATTFMRLLGPMASVVTVTADAAIIFAPAPIPIIVTHPTLAGSFSLSGTTNIKICGGPARSLQVNSSSGAAMSVGNNANVDLHLAGPNDGGDCTTGTGADFAAVGGPIYANIPGWLSPVGATEHFWQPASIIYDPLANVPPPARPTTVNPTPTLITDTSYGCPQANQCHLYSPGTYTNGIDVKNDIAIFKPGLYYMDNGKGFQTDSNGSAKMCTTCAPDSSINGTEPGMVIFNKGGGTFSVGSNGNTDLVGSDSASAYRGILFFQDRFAPTASHTLGGNGSLSLKGTLYITNCDPNDTQCSGTSMLTGVYQTLSIRGGACSSTLIKGQIIASALDLRGGGCIQMNLSPAKLPNIRSVALVR